MNASLTRRIGAFLETHRLAQVRAFSSDVARSCGSTELAEVREQTQPALGKRGLPVLLAVSGGADSTAMLLAFHDLAPTRNLRLTVAHLNHGIRGKAAGADARFVRDLCRRLGVRCVTGRAGVPRLARRKGLSLEMAAREARYRFLLRAARRVGAAAIATAHTQDDQAETVLLKLARGAGPEGLSGIAPCADLGRRRTGGPAHVTLIRPLLAVSRAEIEAFLRARGQDWREDATNLDRGHLRNRVRHDILPVLEAGLNPVIRGTLARTAAIMREENAWMDAEARRHCPRGALETSALAALPPALRRRVCRLWLAAHGVPVERIGFDAVERVERLANQPRGSRSIELAGGWTVRRRYGALAVEQRTTRSPYRTALRIPGDTPLPEPGLRVTVTVAAGIAKPKARCGELPARGSLSRRAVGRRTLYVRSWRPGDRMKPLGMSGSRKLQDIFTDAKIPSDRRSAIPVFECAGEIVWIPGYRVARGWEVPDDSQPAIQVGVESMDEVSPRQEGHRA